MFSIVLLAPSMSLANQDSWTVLKTCTEKTRSCLCKGFYDPEINSETDFGSDITLTSDSGEMQLNKIATLTGRATAEQNQRRLVADTIKVHFKNDKKELDKLEAIGNVKIVSPTERFNGSYAIDSITNSTKELTDSSYYLFSSHGFGESSKIFVDPEEVVHLDRATYSTCSPRDRVWFIRAKKLDLDKNTGWGNAKHSVLYVKDRPVFYWPYLSFPIDDRRKSGFLLPMIQSESYLGRGFGIPYYWNIAPNYDATISPTWHTNSGLRFFGQFRYLTENNEGAIELDFLINDKAYKGFRREKIANPGSIQTDSPQMAGLRELSHRYGFNIQHVGKLSDKFNFQIYYVKAGDDNFIDNVGRRILSRELPVTKHTFPVTYNPQYLPQSFSANYVSQLGSTSFNIRSFQTIYAFNGPMPSNLYRVLPSLEHTFATQSFSNLHITSNTSWYNFAQHRVQGVSEITTGNRYHFETKASLAFDEDPGWFFIPAVHLDILSEDLRRVSAQHNMAKNPTRVLPTYSVDSGLIFERDVNSFKEGYTQTLEPRIKYIYTPFKNQQDFPNFESGVLAYNFSNLFTENRFSGFDRISSTNQLSLALSSNIQDPYGHEVAGVGIGQIYYLSKVRLDPLEVNTSSRRHSPFSSRAFYNVTEKLQTNIDWVYDYKRRINRSIVLGANYFPSEYNVINFNYDFSKDLDGRKTNQIGSSFSLFPQDHLLVQGVAHYDIVNHHLNRIGFGAEWYKCCYSIKLTWMHNRTIHSAVNTGARSRKYDNTIGIQFSLTGFTDVSFRRSANFNIPNVDLPSDYLTNKRTN